MPCSCQIRRARDLHLGPFRSNLRAIGPTPRPHPIFSAFLVAYKKALAAFSFLGLIQWRRRSLSVTGALVAVFRGCVARVPLSCACVLVCGLVHK